MHNGEVGALILWCKIAISIFCGGIYSISVWSFQVSLKAFRKTLFHGPNGLAFFIQHWQKTRWLLKWNMFSNISGRIPVLPCTDTHLPFSYKHGSKSRTEYQLLQEMQRPTFDILPKNMIFANLLGKWKGLHSRNKIRPKKPPCHNRRLVNQYEQRIPDIPSPLLNCYGYCSGPQDD